MEGLSCLNGISHVCYKCKREACDKVELHGVTCCVGCFRSFVKGTIYSSLRVLCSVKRGSAVTVCVSGGDASLVLLHALMEGQRQDGRSLGLEFRSILHVDLWQLFSCPANPILLSLRPFQMSSLVPASISNDNTVDGSEWSEAASRLLRLLHKINWLNIPVSIISPFNVFQSATVGDVTKEIENLCNSVVQQPQYLWVLEDLLSIIRYSISHE